MAGDFDIGPADYYADALTRQAQELGLYNTGEEMNGKGDAPRPLGVDTAEYARRWAETFRACTVYAAGPCDAMGPGGSCLACGRGLETLGDPEE